MSIPCLALISFWSEVRWGNAPCFRQARADRGPAWSCGMNGIHYSAKNPHFIFGTDVDRHLLFIQLNGAFAVSEIPAVEYVLFLQHLPRYPAIAGRVCLRCQMKAYFLNLSSKIDNCFYKPIPHAGNFLKIRLLGMALLLACWLAAGRSKEKQLKHSQRRSKRFSAASWKKAPMALNPDTSYLEFVFKPYDLTNIKTLIRPYRWIFATRTLRTFWK